MSATRPRGPLPALGVIALAVAATVAVSALLLAVALAVALIREYGPSEGYGTMVLQVIPSVLGIVLIGAVLAGLLAWSGARLRRSK